jgi:GT2 family glycosyltransferase
MATAVRDPELSVPAPLRPVTVAICTRNRTTELERSLAAVLRLPDDDQELLVIDNAPSTDATYRFVATFPRVRYVCEPRPGLNVARNRALREARGELVAFCDDDAVVDRGWLRALAARFDAPGVMAVTGLTMPSELDTPAQKWFERHYGFGRGFRSVVFDRRHPLAGHPGAPGVGANMALRRSVVRQVGGFDVALDAGTPTCSGGDNEMFSRILSAGYTIVYEPAALSWHRHRRSWRELRRQVYGYRVGLYATWTKQLVRDHDATVLRPAARRIVKHQVPMLVHSLLRRSASNPLDLATAELIGCLVGPAAYAISALTSTRWRRRYRSLPTVPHTALPRRR